jgi:hypothetical protein
MSIGTGPGASRIESTGLTFAGGSADIMPQSALELSGYWRVSRLGKSVAEPLEVNAILFQCGQERIVFLQFDVLSVGNVVPDKVLAHLQGRVRKDQVFFVASHTHFAPGIDPEILQLGQCDDQYVAFVAETACNLLDRVLAATPQPVFLRYGETFGDFSINRRKWCWAPRRGFPPFRRVMAMQPNFAGARDETVRVFLASEEPGKVKPAGILWNYACHAVSSYPGDRISSDYPGRTRRLLREQFQENLPVVFLPGFSGNIRPNCVARFPFKPYPFVRRVINGPVFGQFTEESGDAWRSSLAGLVMRAATFGLHPVEVSGIHSAMLIVPLEELMEGGGCGKHVIFKLAHVDPLFAVLGMSTEPVIEYAAALQDVFPPRTLIPVGYAGAVAAYLPTSEMLAEGGLEVTSPGYGLENARYRENISQLVHERVRELSAMVAEQADDAACRRSSKTQCES